MMRKPNYALAIGWAAMGAGALMLLAMDRAKGIEVAELEPEEMARACQLDADPLTVVACDREGVFTMTQNASPDEAEFAARMIIHGPYELCLRDVPRPQARWVPLMRDSGVVCR